MTDAKIFILAGTNLIRNYEEKEIRKVDEAHKDGAYMLVTFYRNIQLASYICSSPSSKQHMRARAHTHTQNVQVRASSLCEI